ARGDQGGSVGKWWGAGRSGRAVPAARLPAVPSTVAVEDQHMIRVSDETQKVLLDIFGLGGVAAIEESETRLRDMAREYAQSQRELRSAALAFSTYNGLDIERGLEDAAR